jgi:hypothetical protein
MFKKLNNLYYFRKNFYFYLCQKYRFKNSNYLKLYYLKYHFKKKFILYLKKILNYLKVKLLLNIQIFILINFIYKFKILNFFKENLFYIYKFSLNIGQVTILESFNIILTNLKFILNFIKLYFYDFNIYENQILYQIKEKFIIKEFIKLNLIFYFYNFLCNDLLITSLNNFFSKNLSFIIFKLLFLILFNFLFIFFIKNLNLLYFYGQFKTNTKRL